MANCGITGQPDGLTRGMLTPYLYTCGFDCALVLLGEYSCDLLAGQYLEILSVGYRLIIGFPGRGPRQRFGILVVRTEVSSDRTSVGLVLGNSDVKLLDRLYNVLYGRPISIAVHSRA